MNENKGRGYETGLMVLLSLAFGFVFFDRNAMSYLAPFVAPELHLSYSQIAMLSSAFSLAWATAGYLGSAFSDATGRRKSVLLIAFVIFSFCSILSGLAPSFALLLASRILMGLSEGPILPISQSLLALESSETRRGLNMGFMQNFGSNLIGSTVAPLVLVTLATHYGWRAAFYIAGVPGLIVALLIWKYVREPKTPAATRSAEQQPEKKLSALTMIKTRNIWLCILISIFMVPWMIMGWVFLPLYYVDVRHMDPTQMKLMMSVLGISAALFGFMLPGLSDRIGRKPVVVIFCFIGILTPLAVLYYSGSLLALAVLIFVGWSGSGVFPLFMSTIPSETIPPRYMATAVAIVIGFGEAFGGVLIPYGAGLAADRHGLQAPMLIQAGCALIGTALALLLVETAPIKARVAAAARA